MAPAQPAKDGKDTSAKRTTNTKKAGDKPTPRRGPATKTEPHKLANKRRFAPQPDFDIPVSRVVEAKILGAGWTYDDFATAIGVSVDQLYRARSNRTAWAAWLLNRAAHGLGTTTDAVLILAGQEQPRSTLRQAIEASPELDDRARAVLLDTFEQLALRRQTGSGTSGGAGS